MPKPVKKAKKSAEVLYSEVVTAVCVGENALTVEQAKQLLGFEEVESGADYDIMINGKKCRSTHNTKNRPLTEGLVDRYAQDILNRRWRINGETIVIGDHGEVLSGQHRLWAVIRAEEIRTSDAQKYHWADLWKGPVTMETLVVYGVDENDDIVNTLDTGKPRTFADVIYRSKYFADKSPAQRKTLARMTEHAVRCLWDRTRQGDDAYSSVRTHSESLHFIERHERVLAAVKHIAEENTENAISKWMSPGYASGFLYLMGTSASDVDIYRNGDRCEKELDFSNWERACEFWVLLSSGSTVLKELRYAVSALPEDGSMNEKRALFAKAWGHFLKNNDPDESDFKLEYHTDSLGFKTLIEAPSVGGIDDPVKPDVPKDDNEGDAEPEAEVDIEAAKEQIAKDKEEARLKKLADQKEKLRLDREKKLKAKADAKAAEAPEEATNAEPAPEPEADGEPATAEPTPEAEPVAEEKPAKKAKKKPIARKA